MKRLLFAGLIIFSFSATAHAEWVRPYTPSGIPGPSFYEVNTGDTVTLERGTGVNPGGEFDVQMGGPTLWSGFCLEKSETFNYGTPLRIDSITDRAIGGGINDAPTAGYDLISSQTAWLFQSFWNRTLTGLDDGGGVGGYYTTNQTLNAKALQEAIWIFEDELTPNDPNDSDNFYVELALQQDLTNFGIGGVQVLNLQKLDGNVWVNAQDQLVVISPPPSLGVPEPSSFAGLIGIFSVSLLGYGWRRKRQQVA